jgi:hypothetical protein
MPVLVDHHPGVWVVLHGLAQLLICSKTTGFLITERRGRRGRGPSFFLKGGRDALSRFWSFSRPC